MFFNFLLDEKNFYKSFIKQIRSKSEHVGFNEAEIVKFWNSFSPFWSHYRAEIPSRVPQPHPSSPLYPPPSLPGIRDKRASVGELSAPSSPAFNVLPCKEARILLEVSQNSQALIQRLDLRSNDVRKGTDPRKKERKNPNREV